MFGVGSNGTSQLQVLSRILKKKKVHEHGSRIAGEEAITYA